MEKEQRAAELVLANRELAFQNKEKEQRAAELILANKELAFQNQEKEYRATELVITNNILVNRTRALQESKVLFRNMMETISQMAWTITVSGEATFFNQRWYNYTGIGIKQSKELLWRDITHPDDLRQYLKAFKLIQDGNSLGWTGEVRYKRADDTYRWHLVSVLPIKNEHEEVQLWIGTATDIEALKQLEQQKDDFISIASHELRTPITTLKASLQLLDRMKKEPFSKMMEVLIDRANISVVRVANLIEDLLSASRYKQGQLHLNKTKFSIAKAAEECYNHISMGGKYTVKAEGDLTLEVYADEARVGQVIINFVNNAIKYAPDSREILINIEKLNDHIVVSVSDIGPGIESDKIPHLFDRFFRVDNNGNQYSGLGLGLYISGEIIKRHDGQIGVDSEVGKGSKFWFSLPVFQGK